MPAVYHVHRRGAVYYWRRRVPSPTAARPRTFIAISIGTKDQHDARWIGARLSQMSEELFAQVRRGHLTADEVKSILIAVAKDHADDLALGVLDAQASPAGGWLAPGERTDRIVGAMFRLLSERGRDSELNNEDGPFLESCGLSAADAGDVNRCLNLFRRQKLVPPREQRLRRLLQEAAPEVEVTRLSLTQAEKALYRGLAAARPRRLRRRHRVAVRASPSRARRRPGQGAGDDAD